MVKVAATFKDRNARMVFLYQIGAFPRKLPINAWDRFVCTMISLMYFPFLGQLNGKMILPTQEKTFAVTKRQLEWLKM